MTSRNNFNTAARNTLPKNFRGYTRDRRKIKDLSSPTSFGGRQASHVNTDTKQDNAFSERGRLSSRLNSEVKEDSAALKGEKGCSVNSEIKQDRSVSSIPPRGRSSHFNSSRNDFGNKSPNRRKSPYQQNSAFHQRSSNPGPSMNKNKSAHQQHNSFYYHPRYQHLPEGHEMTHSKYNSQEKSPKPFANDCVQKAKHSLRNQIVCDFSADISSDSFIQPPKAEVSTSSGHRQQELHRKEKFNSEGTWTCDPFTTYQYFSKEPDSRVKDHKQVPNNFSQQVKNVPNGLGNPLCGIDDAACILVGPPIPQVPNSADGSKQVSHKQDEFHTEDMLPLMYNASETREEYLARPGHRIGTGLYNNKFQDLPPRFKSMFCGEVEKVTRMIKDQTNLLSTIASKAPDAVPGIDQVMEKTKQLEENLKKKYSAVEPKIYQEDIANRGTQQLHPSAGYSSRTEEPGFNRSENERKHIGYHKGEYLQNRVSKVSGDDCDETSDSTFPFKRISTIPPLSRNHGQWFSQSSDSLSVASYGQGHKKYPASRCSGNIEGNVSSYNSDRSKSDNFEFHCQTQATNSTKSIEVTQNDSRRPNQRIQGSYPAKSMEVSQKDNRGPYQQTQGSYSAKKEGRMEACDPAHDTNSTKSMEVSQKDNRGPYQRTQGSYPAKSMEVSQKDNRGPYQQTQGSYSAKKEGRMEASDPAHDTNSTKSMEVSQKDNRGPYQQTQGSYSAKKEGRMEACDPAHDTNSTKSMEVSQKDNRGPYQRTQGSYPAKSMEVSQKDNRGPYQQTQGSYSAKKEGRMEASDPAHDTNSTKSMEVSQKDNRGPHQRTQGSYSAKSMEVSQKDNRGPYQQTQGSYSAEKEGRMEAYDPAHDTNSTKSMEVSQKDNRGPYQRTQGSYSAKKDGSLEVTQKGNVGLYHHTQATNSTKKDQHLTSVSCDSENEQRNVQNSPSFGNRLQLNRSDGQTARASHCSKPGILSSIFESNSQQSVVEICDGYSSCSSDGPLSVYSGQSLSNRTVTSHYVKIKVSENVENLDYWKSYLEKTLPHFKFEIKGECEFTQTLCITFANRYDANQARYVLYKAKKNREGPHIKAVKSSRACPRRFPDDVNPRILSDCLRDINSLSDRVILMHTNKIASVKRELDTVQQSHKNDSILVVQEKEKMLEKMLDVFLKYTEAKKNEMKSEIEKQGVSKTTVSLNLVQMKKNFILEYNCLKWGLPIYAKKDEIIDIIQQHQVSVIVAETGSGKSTQLVQYLLQSGIGKNGVIVCTQPRKIAAVSLAKYVSGQIGSPVGRVVGYEVGLDKKKDKNTKIIYMTDYVLLKKCIANRNLEGISCVVIDEAHERSLFTDLVLAVIKNCLPSRPDIHIIITSATIDPGVFREYFKLSGDSILSVPGRIYPVQVKWHGIDAHVGWNYLEECVNCAYDVHSKNAKGDILVFLTSPQETDDAVSLFKKISQNRDGSTSPILLSLHGKQEMGDQMKIFSPTPKGRRKIIFATNAAETSVTIPGVKYVIDCGLAKEKQYIAEKNRNALVVGFISKSSAEQRKGRAGRTQPGVCYRMYSRRNYDQDMPDKVTPEILRINLQLAMLKVLEFRMAPEDFDFVEAPPQESISSALHSLEFLGAIKNKCFTDLGRQISRLPLEPQLSKLVILGAEERVGYEAAVIASLATVSGMLFYRNEDNRATADKKKMKFCKEEGDFSTFLDVFKQWYHTPKEEKPEWCAKNCINQKAMKIAYQTAEELIQTMRFELGIYIGKRFRNPAVFDSKSEKILFECFSENVCVFSGHKKTGYLSPFEPGSFFIHPSSSLSYLDSKCHNFVIFSSVLKTSRPFLLNVTPIQESTIISAFQKGVFPFQIDLLKKLQVCPARIYPIGESILVRNVLGRQGCNLREIEQQIEIAARTDAFYVDVVVEKGEVLIHIDQHHHVAASKVIENVVQEAQCQMAQEEHHFKIADCASSSFAVTCGGIVNDIVLPGEFREVIVEGYSDFSCVISRLKSFGSLHLYKETVEHGIRQVLATYVKARDAHQAVECLQKQKVFNISSKVPYAKLSDKSLPLFRLQVTWPRFPCLGSGWISFQTVTDCIEASGILTNNSFYIGDQYIVFTPKATERELNMKNLPSYVESDDVMKALKDHLPDYLKVKNVNLVRARYHKASEQELKCFERQLFQMFKEYTLPSKLVVSLRSPNASEVSWTAVVYFENFDDGQRALQGLKDKAKIGEHKLHIKPILKSSLHCNMQTFKMVEKHLHVLVMFSKKEGICTEFDIRPNPSKNVVLITFSCSDIDSLNKVRQEIQKLIRGMTLSFADQKKYCRLFSKSGEEFIKSVEQDTQTVINVNSSRNTVTILGLEKAISSATTHITSFISTSSDDHVRIFNLAGRKIPSGFLRALHQKFGFKLRALTEKFNLRAAYVDFVNRKLTVTGSKKTVQMVEQCLAELCVEVKKSGAKNQSSNLESCPVCLDAIRSDLFRLNHCGHAFCRPCLLLQMESKIIPLVCAQKDCEKPWFVDDISKILCGNEELKKEFSQAAIDNFISKDQSIHYCPTPDCSMVYRVTSHSAEFHCPSCENDICTRCQDLYHHGMTCDMFQRCKIDKDYQLKVWMLEDSATRKMCPKCSAPIEKVEGCNHVLCTQCDTHLCWLCTRTFPCSKDVYEHMPFCEHLS